MEEGIYQDMQLTNNGHIQIFCIPMYVKPSERCKPVPMLSSSKAFSRGEGTRIVQLIFPGIAQNYFCQVWNICFRDVD